MAHLVGVSLFGLASTPTGTAFRYKILGVDGPAEGYHLVLEATNVITSYISKFSLSSLLRYLREEQYIEPEPSQLLGWLRQHFEDAEVEAVVDDGGLQLQAVHNVEGDEECTAVIRLPPEGGVQPLTDAKGTAWVAQEVLFSMGEQLRETKRKLEACEQRCPASQQLDDITAFLAASQAAANGAGDGDGASPAPPNVALGRRKQPEPGTAPVSGSAAKGPRPVDAAAAASGQQPASTQLTGGMSTQSGRTDISEKLKPTKVGPKRKGPNPVATKVGRRR